MGDAVNQSASTLAQYPELEAPHERLLAHPIYAAVNDLPRLRAFMQGHVFAVWDFMSLVKRLQRELTCVAVPWVPPRDPVAARLINDIVLAEESDIGPDGQPMSHLELYREAMDEVGADSDPFRVFCAAVQAGATLDHALARANAPEHVRAFVHNTLACAIDGQLDEVIAAFFFGRENVIPEMFSRLLRTMDGLHVPTFAHYLDRHIEVDSDVHGPAAGRILDRYVAGDAAARHRAVTTACRAIEARTRLFDGILATL